MSAIPRAYRVELTEQEFLDTVAYYAIDCRKSGRQYWFYCPDAVGQERKGDIVSPGEVVEFVRNHTFEGEPILKFIRDQGRPSRIGLAYTDAGRRFRRSMEVWKWRVNPPLPRRFARRSGAYLPPR